MVGKKGFLRVAEAVLGVVIVIGFLIVVIERTQNDSMSFESEAKIILDEIAKNETMRETVLNGTVNSDLEDFTRTKLNNPSLNFSISICELEGPCLGNFTFIETEYYAAERVISTNLRSQEFKPKRVKIFIWRN